ncbi:hypothetical protein O7626_19380 [Micromonospora sp. WMMD1102]|uniref:hypothetical protein n=1 Tax=Micromonospora sp. WMMD1102 TaxID=3016105 RepID=UPI00241574D3|nr:hypothetical protein [Micromonospora sp. WMMD1102]MDG4788076.1 hypothetical protein [Micromonospora sp. WMMD1102]
MAARSLPSLPGCGRAASARIEVYSPGPTGTAYGSLDAIAYACGSHQGAVLAMLADAGLTGHVDPDPNAARDMGRPCGHLFRLDALVEPAGPDDHNGTTVAPAVRHRVTRTAAEIVAGPPLPHQPWCAPDGHPTTPTYHVSQPTQIEQSTGETTTVCLEQSAYAPAPHLLIQTWHARWDDTAPPHDPEEADEQILLPLPAAAQLVDAIRGLLAQAEAGGPQ